MAVGDDATNAGFQLVPETGSDEAKVRWGAREINRTRDYIAQVKNTILLVWPISRGGTGGTSVPTARANLGLMGGTSMGTANPVNGVGAHGDTYYKYTP